MSELAEELRQVVVETANEISEALVSDARERISESYPPPSAPGSSPHMRSGDLYESVNAVVYVEDDTISVECGSDLEYAEYLEDGTDTMAPRPMWEGLGEDWSEKVPSILGENIAKRFGG